MTVVHPEGVFQANVAVLFFPQGRVRVVAMHYEKKLMVKAKLELQMDEVMVEVVMKMGVRARIPLLIKEGLVEVALQLNKAGKVVLHVAVVQEHQLDGV